MQLVTLYLATAIVFLGLDAVMLKRVLKPLFEPQIGHLMLTEFRMLPAALFYLFYVGGVLYFVSWPALRDGAGHGSVLLGAAMLGALAYGTYEFTNYALLRDWAFRLVVVDVTWGALLTAISASAGLAIARLIH